MEEILRIRFHANSVNDCKNYVHSHGKKETEVTNARDGRK